MGFVLNGFIKYFIFVFEFERCLIECNFVIGLFDCFDYEKLNREESVKFDSMKRDIVT